MPTPTPGNVLTGARARLSLNGTQVGYATNVSYREEIQYDPIEALDNIEVAEHVPVAYRVSGNMDKVRIIGTTLKSLGWFPSQGTTPEEHLRNILDQGALSLSVEDNKSSQTVAVIEGVRLTERNITVGARGIVITNVSFVGLRARDESDVS